MNIIDDDDCIDDSVNWRSTIDPNSGRTYWYHRKTRISTWIIPQCLVDTENRDTGVDFEEVSSQRTQNQTNLLPSQLDNLIVTEGNSFSSVYSTDDQSELINNLVEILLINNAKHMRLKALLNLLVLSSDRCYAALHFVQTPCWLSLKDQYHKWDDGESKLLLVALFSNLCIGRDTYALLLSSDVILPLTTQIETAFWGDCVDSNNISWNIDMTVFLSESKSESDELEVLTERTIQSYVALICKGHGLPAILMLILIQAAFREESLTVTLIRRGAIAVLQSICLCPAQDQVLRDRARDCLLLAMSQNGHVRERLLDSLLEMSGGLSQLPLACGPDPAVVVAQQDVSLDLDEVSEREDEGRRETVARETLLGYYDIVDNNAQDSDISEMHMRQLHCHRDVEWIPTSGGTSWSLSSVLLWTRCPALRDLIGGFWEEGGAGLELSIRACDEVLASLCRYIHSGIVLLPPGLDKRLQLLRVSAELGMSALYAAIRPALVEALSDRNVHHVLRYAEQNDLPDLQWMCDKFVQAKGVSEALEVRFGLREQFTAQQTTSSSAGRTDRSSSESLRDAISASLLDVTEALREADMSPSKRHAKREAQDYDDSLNEFSADITMEDILMQSVDRSRSRHLEEESASTLFVTAEEFHSEQAVLYTSPDRAGRAQPSTTKSRSGKSGGIYGLLLQSQTQSTAMQPLDNHVKRAHGSKLITPVKNVIASPSAAATPRTQRATRLLAGARPSGVINSSGADFSCDERDCSTIGGNLQGATEFDNKMSLAPPKKATAAERRLLDMAKPRKISGKNVLSSAVQSNESVDSQSEDGIKNTIPTSDKDRKKEKFASLKASASASLALPKTSSKSDDKLEPKRAVSPMSTTELDANSAKMKQSLSLSGSNFPSGVGLIASDGQMVPTDTHFDSAPLESVRGSLTLLKTRATRRRRSVAEVEEMDRGEEGTTSTLSNLTADIVSVISSRSDDISLHPEQVRVPFSTHLTVGGQVSTDFVESEDPLNNDEINNVNRVPSYECPDCGRHFNSGPFQKHVSICQKVFLQKRKAFDSSKMRIEAIPELKEILVGSSTAARVKGKKGANKAASILVTTTAPPTGSSKWKAESDAFRNAMRAARDVQVAIATGAPLPPPIVCAPDSSLTQCPHCSRRFNDKAAERHISHCQNIREKTVQSKTRDRNKCE